MAAYLHEAFPTYYKKFDGFEEYNDEQDTVYSYKRPSYGDVHDAYILEKLETTEPMPVVQEEEAQVARRIQFQNEQLSCRTVQKHIHDCAKCNMHAYWSNLIDIFSYITMGFFFAFIYFRVTGKSI